MRTIIRSIGGSAAAILLATALATGIPGAAVATVQDHDALDIIECDLEGCEVTGIRCAPTCYTGFCCHISPND